MLFRGLLLCLLAAGAHAAEPVTLKWQRVRISDVTYEAASAVDINRDGRLDIVSGEYWFEGPAFTTRHRMCTVKAVGDYFDDFSNIPMDVNGDGYADIISGGWWGATLVWRENPRGRPGAWKVHEIDRTGNIETTRPWDVDGDGHDEIVPNAGGRVAVYRLVRDPAGKPLGRFEKTVVKEGGCGHGLGFGDVNGDGRGDFIVPEGWIEQPADPWKDPWPWHPEFNLGAASVPILVHDVNEDGRADLIVGQAHDYGLDWHEQGVGPDGRRTWTKHPIAPHRSQYHEMQLYDIDRDGRLDLVTGKRYRAHNEHDPGSFDPVGLYYFRIEKGRFQRVTLDYGPAGQASGAGIYLWIADMDGNGWPDILAPGKEGLFLFYNLGPMK